MKMWLKLWYKNLCVFAGMAAMLSPVLYLAFTPRAVRPAEPRIELVDDLNPLGVYNEPLKIKVGQMVSATKYVSGESASNNVVYSAMREIMNIDPESQFSAMIGTAYSYQLGMSMVSNDIPDLFYCNQNELNDVIDQNMVEDLTDAYYKYASPALRLAIEYGYTGDVERWNGGNPIGLEYSGSVLNMVSKNGRIYGFPFLSDLFNLCPLIWIRTDWLAKYAENKGIVYSDISEVMPADFGQYLDIVRYFSSANLNAGKKSYGVGFGFDGAGLQGISNIYGAYPETFLKEEDGTYSYGTTSDNFREAMKLYNELYRTGCVDANSALDGQLLKQALTAGKIGTFIGEFWSIMWGVGDSVLLNSGIDWLPWAVRDYDGNVIEPMVPSNVLNQSCYAIKKGFNNPEAVFIIANHLIDRFYNDDGAWTKKMVEIRRDPKYRMARDEIEMYAPVRLDAPNKNTRYAFDIQKALKTGDTSHLSLDCEEVYETILQYINDPTGDGKYFYTLYKVFGPTGAYTELMKYADYDYETDKNYLKVRFKRPAYEGMYTDEMLRYMSIIKDYVGTDLIDIYVNRSELTNAKWSSFVAGLNQKGMPQILASIKALEK